MNFNYSIKIFYRRNAMKGVVAKRKNKIKIKLFFC